MCDRERQRIGAAGRATQDRPGSVCVRRRDLIEQVEERPFGQPGFWMPARERTRARSRSRRGRISAQSALRAVSY